MTNLNFMARAKKNPNPPSHDPEIQQLKEDWHGLDRYGKGHRLLLVRGRYTLAQLAPEVGCSKKRLRDFEEFGKIRASEREASRKFGAKKALARIRANRGKFRRWEKQLAGETGGKLKDKLAKCLSEWLQMELAEYAWDVFFQGIFEEGCRCDEMKTYAPKLFDEFRFDDDWEKVIESTKPMGNLHDPRYDALLGYHTQWFATWYQRCMPFPEIRAHVARRVRRHLRRTAWRRFGTTVSWTFPPPWK